jgi:hypothetical protein
MTPETVALCLWRKECPLAGIYYRVPAEPSEVYQSYFAPSGKLGKDCPYFIEEKPKEKT